MKVYFMHLGCAKNMVDSEILLGYLKKEGINATTSIDEADILMINTCAFIESAREEAITKILDLAGLKGSDKFLIVCGCLPQRYLSDLKESLPEVDLFLPIDDYKNISKILNGTKLFKKKFSEKFSIINREYTTPSYYKYIKISKGCPRKCAYCAIPLIRGELVSFSMESILEEVREAIKSGTYEINIIAQDTTAYGLDLYKKQMIVPLLKQVCSIEGDFKVRLLYLYPNLINNELIEFIANEDKMMNYFDIPLQHSEKHILDKMKRPGSKELFKSIIGNIRTLIPDAIIRTTLIVGFPYETEKDVLNLVDFIKEVKFDHLGAFTYSPEEDTLGDTYPKIIPEEEKNRRYNLLMSEQQKISLELNKARLGSTMKCFIEHYEEESFMYQARSYAFAPDDIDGTIYVASVKELKEGDIVDVKILDADAYTLTGQAIYEEETNIL